MAQVPISTANGIFYGTNGQATTLMGVNWFGFETSATMVAGLWQGPSALSQDFSTVLYRIQLLGFNTIRLPFSFQVQQTTRVPRSGRCSGCMHAPACLCLKLSGCIHELKASSSLDGCCEPCMLMGT